MTELRIGGATLVIEARLVTTHLHDGGIVYAEPHDTPEYAATAARLGYGSDIARLNRDHELMHSLIASWFRLPESPVMRAVADDTWRDDPRGLLALEEDAVCALQRFATAHGVDLLELAELLHD